MGFVLGPVLRKQFMSNFENNVFNTINKSNIYLSYIDDILFLTNCTIKST